MVPAGPWADVMSPAASWPWVMVTPSAVRVFILPALSYVQVMATAGVPTRSAWVRRSPRLSWVQTRVWAAAIASR